MKGAVLGWWKMWSMCASISFIASCIQLTDEEARERSGSMNWGGLRKWNELEPPTAPSVTVESRVQVAAACRVHLDARGSPGRGAGVR
eukprot:5275775-Pleurochrysis_carterae.AAC.1